MSYIYLVDLLSYEYRGGDAVPFATLDGALGYLPHVTEWDYERFPDGEEMWTQPESGMSAQWLIYKREIRP